MTPLDAFDLAVCDDAELGPRTAAADAQPRRELIERYVPLARRLALRSRWSGEAPDDRPDDPRRAAPVPHASMAACGGWSMSDATEGTTA
jgi:hypothetical protein